MNRPLTNDEINLLKLQNCSAEDWAKIKVAHEFEPSRVRNTSFSGDIVLGRFDHTFVVGEGIPQKSGIYNAVIHNCQIGNNVYINNINNYIANYLIEDNVSINNVDMLAVEGTTSFGNNTKVAVLSETGGREVSIFDHLSSQMAYIMAVYRHRPGVLDKLNQMIVNYTASVTSTCGTIGAGTRISSCNSIKNVNIGPCAHIEGCHRLANGTVNSCEADPTTIGFGVTVENFIIATGAKLGDSAMVYNCFVGQGCELSKQYSAENSLFFANSAGFHGEASSIFAGPFTVTHHKSTLLIAGMFSFMNAGSGSNQSNHMYKLGPIHQGIMDRGAKTASDSYILWPSKIGSFTSVMGRHYKHVDTSDMPFSYLIELNDESVLVPGAALRSVGTIRDAKKWPRRDRRRDPVKLDFINYNLLSPYTIQKVILGREILETLQEFSGTTTQTYTYKNAIIRNSSLVHGLELYKTAILKFLGNSIISRLQNYDISTVEELVQRLRPSTQVGRGDWVDIGGMIAPKSSIIEILDDIDSGVIDNVENLHGRFKTLDEQYYELEWTWAYDQLHRITDKPIERITPDDICEIVRQWCTAVVALDEQLYNDAHKEFTLDYRVSFGADGTPEERNIDFEQVRGDFKANPFVTEVLDHIKIKTELAELIYDKMSTITHNA